MILEFIDGEERTKLIITWDNGQTEYHYDGGDPEDNSFGRDYAWVCEAIERAYNEGYMKGLAGEENGN
jgi:hypothetical protein